MRVTVVGIDGAKFLINGQPTYKGRTWNGRSIKGLLFKLLSQITGEQP